MGDSEDFSDKVPARPIRLVLPDTEHKFKILKNAKKIRNSSTDKFHCKKVFFIPDQTALEREDDVELIKKLEIMKNRHQGKHFIIKGKKIIEKVCDANTEAHTGSTLSRS